MACKRRRKAVNRNISGLRGQRRETVSNDAQPATQEPFTPAITSDLEPNNVPIEAERVNDSEGEGGYGSEQDDVISNGSDESEIEADEEGFDSEWEEDMDDEEFCSQLIALAVECGDDPRDEDWVPERMRCLKKKRQEMKRPRPKHYKKGPDVASKSERTQSRYRKHIQRQKGLDVYGFTRTVHHACRPDPVSEPTTVSSTPEPGDIHCELQDGNSDNVEEQHKPTNEPAPEPSNSPDTHCTDDASSAGEWDIDEELEETTWRDESTFHANEYAPSLWLREGENVLRKKGRGQLIHVSDFVTEASGRLVLFNANGEIVEDARQIIYPGTNGDAWWDHEQLLAQVKRAIQIFEKAHPGCQALFIFDQSSAHASLGPDALHAFEMNKSNGGKQRHQRDTVIPMNNPVVELRGKPQPMKLPNGQPKGLQQVLEERGFDVKGLKAKCKPVCPFENKGCCMARLLSQQDNFANQISLLEELIRKAGHECIFLPKFHCELNPIEMYWGWCKYRYRQIPKRTFEDAKQAALQCLNSCPTDVIRRFANHSWRFMDAYRKGLSGNAAAWAVKKQKGHQTVSQRAMLSIEAVLN
ncbi:hypothetical protein AB1N83_013423 [Pleurotus pulmonarius]